MSLKGSVGTGAVLNDFIKEFANCIPILTPFNTASQTLNSLNFFFLTGKYGERLMQKKKKNPTQFMNPDP